MPNLNQPEFNDVREHPGFVMEGQPSLRFREGNAVEYFEGVERTDA